MSTVQTCMVLLHHKLKFLISFFSEEANILGPFSCLILNSSFCYPSVFELLFWYHLVLGSRPSAFCLLVFSVVVITCPAFVPFPLCSASHTTWRLVLFRCDFCSLHRLLVHQLPLILKDFVFENRKVACHAARLADLINKTMFIQILSVLPDKAASRVRSVGLQRFTANATKDRTFQSNWRTLNAPGWWHEI